MAGAAASVTRLCVYAVFVLLTISSWTFGDATCSLSPSAQPPSLAGQIVLCPRANKKCLDLNKVLFEGKCYTVGSPGPCRKHEIFVIDKEAFMESKLVQGACRPLFSCDRNQFQERMFHDQCCYETADIKKHICSAERNLRLRKNVFGEGECELISNASNEVKYSVPNARLKEGLCYFPNVSFEYKYELISYEQRFEHLKVQHALTNLTVKCTEKQRECFQSDRVLFAGDGKCYPLLSRGPCQPGSWLVLDEGTLEAGRTLTAVCSASRCLPGQLFMAREQRCRSVEELQTELCSAEDILFDVFGEAHCSRFTSQKHLLRMPDQLEGDSCVLTDPAFDKEIFAGGQSDLLPMCGPNDQNRCKFPVVNTPEKPRP